MLTKLIVEIKKYLSLKSQKHYTLSAMTEIIIYGILIIGSLLFFKKISKDKSPLGVNLKRVYCPVCHTKQPIIRMPGSLTQALVGGTTCPKCKTNLDKYGDIIT